MTARIGISAETINLIRPLAPRNTFEFVTKKLRTPPGKPFNAHDYPWVKGICDAWDNPDVRQVTLQMAARLGKSMTAQALMVSAIEHDPDVGMIAMANKKLLEETIEDKYYRIFENTNATRHLIPSEHNRNKQEIVFGSTKIYGAWSGSTTTLADKPPKYKHAGEVDKFDKAKSREADSLKLFLQRGIEIPDRKSLVESTPDLKQTSRIEKHLESGWNCRFLIPCPKCKQRIQLIPGDGKPDGAGGVRFDYLDGKPHPQRAYKTARYVCQECGEEWGDLYRRPAILQGKWCPEGFTMTPGGKLRGELVGDPENASFQLGRLYAPTFKFGDIAKQIAKCLIDPDEWQDTRNSWFGVTHTFRASSLSWEETAERLSTIEYKIGEVPRGGQFLTVGIDVQDNHFVYVVVAWGKFGVGWVVDFGTCWTIADIKEVITTKYKHQDGGPPLMPWITLIDSGEGERQDEIIDICQRLNKKKGPWVWPSKGSKSGLQSGKAYKKQKFEEMEDRKKKHKRLHGLIGFFHISVNTPWTQNWINKALFFKEPGQPKSIAVPTDCVTDEDFFLQLINERREGVDTTDGHGTNRWVVVDESIPWDFRDSLRYARAAAEVFTRSAWLRVRATRRMAGKKPVDKKRPTPKKAKASAAKAKSAKDQGKRFLRTGSRRNISQRFIRGG